MTPTATPIHSSAPPKFHRSLKNYLLDRRFQLRYTGYLVGITVAISLALGLLLYQQSSKTVAIGNEAVRVGAEASMAGKDAVAQSRSLTTIIQSNADRNYADSPGLLKMVQETTDAENAKILARSAKLDDSERALKEQRQKLERQRLTLFATLGGVLGVLVLIVGAFGIVFSHKVAGPIYKMKRLLRDVGRGKLVIPGSLRKGDELQDFFDVFAEMVRQLRGRQELEIRMLDEAIAAGRGASVDASLLARLVDLRVSMQGELERK